MELLANLALGFDTAFTLQNLLYCFAGVLIGTLVGVLPGLGPVAYYREFGTGDRECLHRSFSFCRLIYRLSIEYRENLLQADRGKCL